MKQVLWFVSILLVATYICGAILDPDLWWHIVIGRWIIANQAVPHAEHWNLFALGQPFIAYSWLFEVVVAWIEQVFQIKGLLSFKLILVTLLSFSLAYIYGRITKDWTFGLLLGIFASAACHSHLTLRPQLVVWVLFAWLLYYSEANQHKIPTIFDRLIFLGILCLWSNCHITQALAIGTLLLWNYSAQHRSRTVLLCLWAFLGSLLTPYFGMEWAVFFSKTGHPLDYSQITEFQPLHIMHFATAFLLCILALLLALLRNNPRLLSVGQYILLLCFTLAALAVAKFLPFAIILYCFSVAKIWAATGSDRGNLSEGLRRLIKFVNSIPEQGLAFLLLVLVYLNIRVVWQQPINTDIVPVAAVDFMVKNRLPHPWLHEFGQGGYVMYQLSDQLGQVSNPVVIDGRTNVNPPKIWQAYQAAVNGQHNWSDFINLVSPQTILWRGASSFVTILKVSKEWCQAFTQGAQHDGYVVLVRSDSEFAAYCSDSK